MDAVDDADDICPVCDGQCTCHAPLAPPPVLKIKLSLPPSMRVQPKKRGRPPKYAHKRPSSKRPPPPPPRKAKRKKIQPKRRRASHSSSSELTELSDIGHALPTFIPADDIISSRSSSDEDDSSDSDSDSSGDDSEIQEEEESFIRDSWLIKSRNASVPPESRDPEAREQGAEEDEYDEEDLVEGLHDEEDDETDQLPTMHGLVTGWSEDEESSFDADIFFANLDASDSSRASSPVQAWEGIPTPSSPSPPRPTHTFEVAEDWTGTLMFTNGADSATFSMDMDLDADDEDDGSMSSSSFSSRRTSPPLQDFDEELADAEDDDYDGESTDGELVGADGLPTPRLMKLFRMPASVGVVNPQSTSKRSDEEEMDIELEIQGRGKVPLMGRFADHHKERVRGRERIAIISGETSVDDIPSPFGKRKTVHASPLPTYRNRSTSLSSTASSTTIDQISDPATPMTLPFPLATQLSSALSSLSTVQENEVDITDVLAPEFFVIPAPAPTTPCTPDFKLTRASTSAIVDHASTDVDEELKHLHRWDVISVGAYRRTRHKEIDSQEAAAIAAAALHTSPMATLGAAMLYQQNNQESSSSKSKKKGGGDQTPTPSRTRHQIPPPLLPPPPKKELNKGKARRKEKEIGAVHQHHRHHKSHASNNHHHRGHFPNSKRRSTGSLQRSSSPLISGF